MAILLKTVQVVLALSILIVIHEFGHFSWAILFHIRVDKFFLFFDVGGFRLLSTKHGWFSKLFPSLKHKETEYGIGWLPLGGYCKINGMIDESMDTEVMKQDPKPWEFRTKPAWKRLLVMFGGVLNNFLFAIFVFILIMWIWGDNFVSNKDNRIYVNDLAYDMGFRTGDRILSFDDYVPQDFDMLQADLARRQAHEVKVLRGKDTVTVYVDQKMMPQVLNTPGMFNIAVPFVVDTIPPQSPNYGAGFKRGDRIVSVDTTSFEFLQDARPLIAAHAGGSVDAGVVRDGDTLSIPMAVDSSGSALIYARIPGVEIRSYNLIQAVPAGLKLAGRQMNGYLQDLKMVATPSTGAYKSVGSFIAIGQVFPSTWDWYRFLYLLALLSTMLGVMNLIPIPALDGGHIVFTLYEMLTGRKPGLKFLEAAQVLGMFFLLLLMFLAFGNDFRRLF